MRARKNIIPKSISYGLISIITMSSIMMCPAKVYASTSDFKDQLSTLTISLRHILDNKKENLIEEIKTNLIKNDWDYTLTMEKIEDQDIYKDINYVDMIAAYMTAKDYCRNNNVAFTYFEDLPLITYEAAVDTATEYIPLKVPHFKLDDNGKYIPNGYIYIIENESIDTYEEKDGSYIKSGTQNVKLDSRDITYADITFDVMTAEEILNLYDLPEEEFNKYRKRIKALTETTSSNSLYQTMFAKLPSGYTYEGNIELLDESYQRQIIVSTAATMIGMIPYEWGGKPTKPGYDTNWWTFDENNNQKGLDCSGFLQWTFLTAGYDEQTIKSLATVKAITESGFAEVTKDELRPGDVGVWYGPITNHVGIYAGNGKWIHCAGGSLQTVVMDDFGFVKYFKVVDDNKTYDSDEIPSYGLIYSDLDYSDEDIYLLASLVQHEAGNEGLNGWIGVAEVVKNRVESDIYPNTIEEVIYQDGQFTTATELAKTPPTEEIISATRMVLSGQLSILDNPLCMYFRNPMITNGIDSSEREDWGPYKYLKAIGHHAFYVQS